MTNWEPVTEYTAKIGGIIYRNVARPITVNDEPILLLERDRDSGQLSVELHLRTQDGAPIATIRRREVQLVNSDRFLVLEGPKRVSVLERATHRVWCDLKYSPAFQEYELDFGALLFAGFDYPLVLHPDRSKFGRANDDDPPNIAGLTLTTDRGSQATAIGVEDGALYLLGVAIENFATGIAIAYHKGEARDE